MFAIRGGPKGLPLVVIQNDVRLFVEKLAGRGGVNGVFIYICKGVHRWVGSPGDWIAVDTAEKGELQFLVPELNLELFDSSRSGRGMVGALGGICRRR